jgi:hypothetical protein
MAYLSYSTYFNGSTTLTTPSNSAFSFGTGDFTVEFWIKAASQASFIYDNRGAATPGNPHVTLETTILRWGPTDLRGTIVIADNTWHHCAITRQSNTVKLWVDGVLDNSGADSTNYNTNQPARLGTNSYGGGGGGAPITGYFSNFRIVNGTAVYTSTFTPPTLPLTAISGTSLLTCQSATTVDNSTNNFTITTTGTAVISNSNTPFNVTLATKDIYTRPTPRVNSVNKLTTETSSLLTTNMYSINGLSSKVITRPTLSVISVIKLTTETSSLLTTNMYSINGLSSKVITRPALSITSVVRLTTETNSLVTTRMYSINGLSSKVITRPALSIFSVIRFSTYIKTSNDPIVDAAANATNQTWTIS